MKKIVYTDINEEITSIFDRVRSVKAETIFLIVPRKAVLFQSVINLAILKSKLADLNKTLIIVTNDQTGHYLAKRAGMLSLESIEIPQRLPQQEADPPPDNHPIQARRNELARELPKRFTEKKVTLRDLIMDFRSKAGKKKSESEAGRYFFLRPNRKFLLLIVVFSVLLFGLISYLALAGATIYIKPRFDYIDYTANVIFADERKNQRLLREYNKNVVPSQIINTLTNQTKIFKTISKEFEGVRSKGTIKIINNALKEWPFKKGTRFQTEEGLIFRIQSYVIVPPATLNDTGESTPGQSLIAVEADDVDIYNNVIGERGNIGPATFFIPGISKQERKEVHAVSEAPMTGGLTQYRNVVRASDIEAAKSEMQDSLMLIAREDLRAHLGEINKLQQTHLVLLDDPRILKVDLKEMRLSEDLEGSYRDKFEIFARMSVEGVAFDFDRLFDILSRELKKRTHPDRQVKIDSLDPESITYEVIDEDLQSGQIKVTATIRGIEEFLIEENTPAGQRFGEKLKEKVFGLSIAEAQKIIANLPEVERAEIRMWPIWLKKMPPLSENIAIRVLEE